MTTRDQVHKWFFYALGLIPIWVLDAFVLNRIAGGQVFITCCEDDRLPVLLGGKVFHVKQGTISG